VREQFGLLLKSREKRKGASEERTLSFDPISIQITMVKRGSCCERDCLAVILTSRSKRFDCNFRTLPGFEPDLVADILADALTPLRSHPL
jgi:hypothetical protein